MLRVETEECRQCGQSVMVMAYKWTGFCSGDCQEKYEALVMSKIVEHTEHELEELIRAAKDAAWRVGYIQGVLDEQTDATHSSPYRKGSPNVYGD